MQNLEGRLRFSVELSVIQGQQAHGLLWVVTAAAAAPSNSSCLHSDNEVLHVVLGGRFGGYL